MKTFVLTTALFFTGIFISHTVRHAINWYKGVPTNTWATKVVLVIASATWGIFYNLNK